MNKIEKDRIQSEGRWIRALITTADLRMGDSLDVETFLISRQLGRRLSNVPDSDGHHLYFTCCQRLDSVSHVSANARSSVLWCRDLWAFFLFEGIS